MNTDRIASERQRALALLAPERLGFALESATPNPSPDGLGALAGQGWLARDPEVRVNVYIFETWEQGSQVAAALADMVNGDGYYAQALVNGTLMLFAVTDAENPEACQRLDHLMSAFAGLE